MDDAPSRRPDRSTKATVPHVNEQSRKIASAFSTLSTDLFIDRDKIAEEPYETIGAFAVLAVEILDRAEKF